MRFRKFIASILAMLLASGCVQPEEKKEIIPANITISTLQEGETTPEDCTIFTYGDMDSVLDYVIETDQTVKDVQILDEKNNVLFEMKELNEKEPLLFKVKSNSDFVLSYTDTTKKEIEKNIKGIVPREFGEDIPVGPYQTIVLQMGLNAAGYKEVETYVEAEYGLNVNILLSAIEKETHWNLSLAQEVIEHGNDIFIDFSNQSSIVMGPPQQQVDAYHAYDSLSLVQMILGSVAQTIHVNYLQDCNIHFSVNGEDIVVEGVSFPISQSW